MTIKLNQTDHNNLNIILGKILDEHLAGTLSRQGAIGALAHILTAAAIDNEDELKKWLSDPAVFERFMDFK
ncbi:MAG: hypothetical protein ACSHXW_18105 [Yoonia sp.]